MMMPAVRKSAVRAGRASQRQTQKKTDLLMLQLPRRRKRGLTRLQPEANLASRSVDADRLACFNFPSVSAET
jgi:hypothetical protein